MLCKINHLGRHLDTCRQPLPFTETIPSLLFLCSATLAGDVPPPWPNLSQLSVGQVQVNFCFSFACHNASLECFLWRFCSMLPEVGFREGKGEWEGGVARLEVEAAVASARFLGSLLSSTHAGFLSCSPFLTLSLSSFSAFLPVCPALSLPFHIARIFTRFSPLRWTKQKAGSK